MIFLDEGLVTGLKFSVQLIYIMTEFEFSGELDQGRKVTSFQRTVSGNSMKHARENLYSQLCSEHSVVRSRISIEEENEV